MKRVEWRFNGDDNQLLGFWGTQTSTSILNLGEITIDVCRPYNFPSLVSNTQNVNLNISSANISVQNTASGNNIFVIIGASVGGALFCILVVSIILLIVRRNRKKFKLQTINEEAKVLATLENGPVEI